MTPVDWPDGLPSNQPNTGRWQDRRTTKHSSVLLALMAAGLVPLVSLLAVSQAQPSPAPANQTRGAPNYLETGRQITGILDRFMSLGYDKRVRPNYGGPPVEVNVTMRILSISSVSEVQMDFTADFYFRQTWHDPRLSFKKLGDIQTLYVGAEVSKKIWLPDTFFGNEKMAYFHEATTPNVFLRIDHSGEVYRSIRLTVTSSCPMNLQYFPMDKQRCTIEAESYGYNVKDIIYKWARKETAVERDKEISLPQFDIVKTVQTYRLEELSSGTYSRLIAEIHFARRMGYYLIQIYIPSSLIVVISWVSFWLHRNASPARVQLGVTTVLTMTTLMSSTNAALPKISYVKSIDIFLGTCFVMVFAALLEYATVGYLGKRIAMRRAQVQHAQTQAQARAFATLQAQGAQGDPVPAATAAELDLLAAAAAATTTTTAAAATPTAPAQPSEALLSASLGQTLLAHAAGATKQLDALQLQSSEPVPRLTNPICPLARATSQSFNSKSATSRWFACRNTSASFRCSQHNHQHHHHHHHPHNQHHPLQHHHLSRGHLELASGCQQYCCSNQQLRQACSCQHQTHQAHTCQLQQGPLCHEHLETTLDAVRSGGSPPVAGRSASTAAAAAAAATFVNLHRRNKGLPPSTNPNFVPYAWPAHRGLETIFGVRPSDIDKYSRVVFPVCFVCFQLMYWFVYLHISAFLESEQLQPQTPAMPPGLPVPTSS